MTNNMKASLCAEAETPMLWSPDVKNWFTGKRPWCWEWLKVGGERDDRGWDGWMASLIQWTWVWISSGGWWWTGQPGILQSMGSVHEAWVKICELVTFMIGIKEPKFRPQEGSESGQPWGMLHSPICGSVCSSVYSMQCGPIHIWIYMWPLHLGSNYPISVWLAKWEPDVQPWTSPLRWGKWQGLLETYPL